MTPNYLFCQEQLLGQLRDVLQHNSSKMVAKEKDAQDYASRLAVMRSNRKASSSSAKTAATLDTSMASSSGVPDPGSAVRGERMMMLRKQMDETKARQEAEQRSGGSWRPS